MSDADVDGAHPDLLLTLFFRHFPSSSRRGHVYGAAALYRIDVPAQGKKRPPRRLYALDEGELAAMRERLERKASSPTGRSRSAASRAWAR